MISGSWIWVVDHIPAKHNFMIDSARTGLRSNVRQIINAFFDVSVRGISVDPVVAVGMRDNPYFWPQKSNAAERKKGPNIIAPSERGHDRSHVNDRSRSQPVARSRVDRAHRTCVIRSVAGLMRTPSIANVAICASTALTMKS